MSYVGDVSACGYEYSREQLGALVSETAYFLKVTCENDAVSDNWMDHFLARWPELDVEMDSVPLASLRCIKRAAVNNYYRELMRLMQKYDLVDKPDRIFRIHDTVFDTEKRGVEAVDITPESQVTILSCMNAAGHVLPPYIVFSGRRMTRDLLVGGLPGTTGIVSNNGMTNGRSFQKFLKDHFLSIVPCSRDNPVLVLYDGHRPYINMPLIDWAEQQFIVLYLMPPQAVSAQHSEDSAFKPLKTAYQQQCDQFLVDNIGRIVTRYDVCDLVGKAYQQVMTQEVIVPTFRNMGVVPYDPSVVTYAYTDDDNEVVDRADELESDEEGYTFVDVHVKSEHTEHVDVHHVKSEQTEGEVALKTEPL